MRVFKSLLVLLIGLTALMYAARMSEELAKCGATSKPRRAGRSLQP